MLAGTLFVYVTHDQMEAMTLATQICLINNGVLQQYDAPLTVYNKPNNLPHPQHQVLVGERRLLPGGKLLLHPVDVIAEGLVLIALLAPLTVYNKPNNLFVADFVGNPSINFIEGRGKQRPDGGVELTLRAGNPPPAP